MQPVMFGIAGADADDWSRQQCAIGVVMRVVSVPSYPEAAEVRNGGQTFWTLLCLISARLQTRRADRHSTSWQTDAVLTEM